MVNGACKFKDSLSTGIQCTCLLLFSFLLCHRKSAAFLLIQIKMDFCNSYRNWYSFYSFKDVNTVTSNENRNPFLSFELQSSRQFNVTFTSPLCETNCRNTKRGTYLVWERYPQMWNQHTIARWTDVQNFWQAVPCRFSRLARTLHIKNDNHTTDDTQISINASQLQKIEIGYKQSAINGGFIGYEMESLSKRNLAFERVLFGHRSPIWYIGEKTPIAMKSR